jgi:tripartite-type tricarboxylate transporter receptor subunit TctC
VPTTAEAGLPGLISTSWFALAAPPKMPAGLAADLAKTAIDVIKLPDVQAKIRAVNYEPVGNTPSEMAAFIKEEAQRWGEVIRKNNIAVD